MSPPAEIFPAESSAPPAPFSAFLPADYDPSRPIALIAGQGRYPEILTQAVRAAGVPLRLIAFDGETPSRLIECFRPDERRMVRLGQLGKMLRSLEELGAAYAIMAGRITPRRLFKGLHPDLRAARLLFSLKRRNAETIFGGIAAEIEAIGIRLLDARSFLDGHLAQPGSMTGGRFPVETAYLEHGISIAREVARLDIGQGVVVRKGTVIAVEAFEGTDEMLRRAGGFEADEMLFIKMVKPNQDYRFDVPVFGQITLETMRAAGIRYAALEAGNCIMLERDVLVREARGWGIHLYGF